MKKIRLWFSDFGYEETESAIRQRNYVFKLLQQRFALELVQHEPDFLIYSCWGEKFYGYRCPRILYLDENIRPNWRECDFAFSFDMLEDKRHYRLPIFALLSDTPPYAASPLLPRRRRDFCKKKIVSAILYIEIPTLVRATVFSIFCQIINK